MPASAVQSASAHNDAAALTGISSGNLLIGVVIGVGGSGSSASLGGSSVTWTNRIEATGDGNTYCAIFTGTSSGGDDSFAVTYDGTNYDIFVIEVHNAGSYSSDAANGGTAGFDGDPSYDQMAANAGGFIVCAVSFTQLGSDTATGPFGNQFEDQAGTPAGAVSYGNSDSDVSGAWGSFNPLTGYATVSISVDSSSVDVTVSAGVVSAAFSILAPTIMTTSVAAIPNNRFSIGIGIGL